MTRPIYSHAMLKTATLLAAPRKGAGRPALTDLRRATSTAYYALFHQITRHGAYQFLPNASEDQAAEIARWFTHTGILKASQLVVKAAGPLPLAGIGKDDRSSVMALRASAGLGGMAPQLVEVAEAFVTLQDARHSADYDSDYDPYRAVTLNHVAQAEAACASAKWLWNFHQSHEPARLDAERSYECFLMLATLKSGGPKAR